MLVKCLMKFTRFITLCHKTLGLPSPKVFMFLILMSPYTNLKLKAENVLLKQSTLISLSTHNASGIVEIIQIKPSKKHLKIYRNIEHLLPLEKQLTLFMYTCLSHVFGRKKITFYLHFNTLINSQFFKTVKQKG